MSEIPMRRTPANNPPANEAPTDRYVLVPEPTEPLPALNAPEGLLSWVASVDHKLLGIMYILTSVFFFLLGGIEALLMRIQLSRPENQFLDPTFYNQLFTMHGTTMVFLVVMPILIGYGTYLLPLMIGARDMAFPRLNALSYWTFLFGGLLLYFSFVSGYAPSVGWFSYAPLSERPYTTNLGPDYWALGLLATGVGSVGAGVNFITTTITMRVKGLSFMRLPLFAWMTFINGFLIIVALPILNASLIMLEFDRQLLGHFFRPENGGSAVLWQHYFWGFGHPEVYIMVLPAFGMISEIIPVFSRKPIFGYQVVAGSTIAIGFLSFAVWAHHMFSVGLGHWFDVLMGIMSAAIAVPTGIKIFNWVATLYKGAIRFDTPMLFAIAFLVLFPMGGVTGVQFALFPLDWQLTDSYYVVAHMHYVLFGGTAFAVLGGAYYWFPKMTGKMMSERLGKIDFWLFLIGFNMTFFIQHILGMLGMPRRVYTYPNLPGWDWMNLVSTIGAFILAIAVIVLVWNFLWSLRYGKPAGDNPWNAWTLEWATSSPPPIHNFDQIPPVRGRRPLWDVEHPDQADWKQQHH